MTVSSTPSRATATAGIVILVLAGFLWDLATPPGYVPWLLYVPALMFTLALPYRWGTLALASLCTVLVLLGCVDLSSGQGGNAQAALFNRTLGIAILWLVAGGCLFHQRAETSLRKNETRFRVIFEQAAVGVAQIETATGRFVHVNQRYCEIVGLSAERMTASTFMDLTHAADLQEDLDNLARLVAGTIRTFMMDKRYVRPDGSIVWVTLTVSPMWAPGERPDYHIAVVEDITARKRVEEKLDLVSKELQDILDSAPAMIWYKDKENRILRANKPAAESIGLSPQEVAGRSTYDLYPKDAAKYHADDLDVIRSGRPKLGIVEPYQVGRETRWVRSDKIPYRNETGEITGVVVFAQDITEHKRAEHELKDSEERYRSAVTALDEGIILENADGVILTCNQSAERILGLSADQMMGKTSLDPDWGTMHEDGSPFPGETHPIMVTVRTGRSCKNVTMGVRKPDGALTWISINTQPLYRDQETKPYAAVASFVDITERRRLEAALRQSHEQLQALHAHLQSVREDERARIARELHDDLGQTLTGLKMDLASLAKTLTPPFTNFQTSRALAKLDDMQTRLNVSIQDIRRMVLELRPPVLDHLGLDGALEWLAHDFQKRHGILCKFHSVGPFDTIDASVATALFRVAQEALTNVALHAKAATLCVDLAHEEQHLRMTITDDGIGLNEAEVTKPTSFGLIGIQERVRLLDGTVAFQGHRSRGTRVIVRIPWERAS
nr:PAS domain S-box protein [Nitrospirota bacterium]